MNPPPSPSTPLRRGERRDVLPLTVTLFCGTFAAPIEVDATDLSPAGLFVASDLLLYPGDRVLLGFLVPGTWHRVLIDARVARACHEGVPGMGLEFAKLPHVDETILRGALARRRAAIGWFRPDGAFRC
jgi:hypothetical protein